MTATVRTVWCAGLLEGMTPPMDSRQTEMYQVVMERSSTFQDHQSKLVSIAENSNSSQIQYFLLTRDFVLL